MFRIYKIINKCPKRFFSTINQSYKLSREIVARIKLTGPITVADYMKEVLTNPTMGYYMHRDVFGERGDFVTSPEMGQMFGELIAVWFLSELEKIGDPTPLQLIELGPGRGTLACDMLRVFRHIQKDTYPFMSLHLVEISPYLSEVQAKTLNVTIDYDDAKQVIENDGFKTATNVSKDERTEVTKHYKSGVTPDGLNVYWYHSIEDIPKSFSILVAHEFFDVLPIHKIKKTEYGWREILIDYDESVNKFKYVLSRTPTALTRSSHLFYDPNDKRDELEISPKCLSIIEHIANRFEEVGGIGLIADYGHFGDKTDTFRAYKNHKQQDPLLNPGSADLTADIDFKQIINVATKDSKLIAFGPVIQQRFLDALGIEIRLDVLLKSATNPQQIESLNNAYKMMTDPKQMGECFKFISLFPSVLQGHLQKYPVHGFQ